MSAHLRAQALLLALVLAGVVVVSIVMLKRAREIEVPPPTTQATEAVTALSLVEITRESGMDVPIAVVGARAPQETFAGGAALVDLDGDDDLDVVFAYGRAWSKHGQVEAGGGVAVLENDGAGRFADVTARAGLDAPIRALGVASGDYDGDGRVDLFFSAIGADRLMRNLGEWRFEDATASARVGGDPACWSAGAVFFDMDGDSDLDLFVAALGRDPPVDDLALAAIETHPPAHPRLYANDGNGAFADVAQSAGLWSFDIDGVTPATRALGVCATDLDLDGRIDLLMAGYASENRLFHNQGAGRFKEIAGIAGLGFDALGNLTDDASFAIGRAGDVGAPLIYAARLGGAPLAAMAIDAEAMHFIDRASAYGLCPENIGGSTASAFIPPPAFGIALADLDLDGREDMIIAGGAVEGALATWQGGATISTATRYFLACGAVAAEPRFRELTGEAIGVDAIVQLAGRAALSGDLDGDGDLDLLITAARGEPLLLRNDLQSTNRYLQVKLVGRAPNTQALGARLMLDVDGQTQSREISQSGYLSTAPTIQTLGLGAAPRTWTLRIHWPDGEATMHPSLELDRLHTISR